MTGGYTGDAEVVHIAASILVSVQGVPEDDPLVQYLFTARDQNPPDPLAVNFGQSVIDRQATADRRERRKWRNRFSSST